jgi:hypothetical protein
MPKLRKISYMTYRVYRVYRVLSHFNEKKQHTFIILLIDLLFHDTQGQTGQKDAELISKKRDKSTSKVRKVLIEPRVGAFASLITIQLLEHDHRVLAGQFVRCLTQVDRQEAEFLPESEQVSRQAERHAQVGQVFGLTLVQLHEKRRQRLARLNSLLQQTNILKCIVILA